MTVKVKMKIKKKDMGFKDATKRLEDLEKSEVLVGLPGANSPQAKDRDGKPIGLTVAQLGVIHEFGSESAGIPARPFMEQTRKENWEKTKKKVAVISRNIASGAIPLKTALAMLGAWYEGRIKHQIRNGDFKPNAPATIARKKSSRPLIDTGLMRNSVTHIVKARGVG